MPTPPWCRTEENLTKTLPHGDVLRVDLAGRLPKAWVDMAGRDPIYMGEFAYEDDATLALDIYYETSTFIRKILREGA
jgi:hypothetical protein